MTRSYRVMADSIEDVANIPRPVFMVSKFSGFEDILLVSWSVAIDQLKTKTLAWFLKTIILKKAKTGVLSKIGDSLRKYPELRLNFREHAIEYVIKYQRSFTSNKAGLLAMIEQDMKETNQCRLYLTKKSWETIKLALGLPKFSPIVQMYNYQ